MDRGVTGRGETGAAASSPAALSSIQARCARYEHVLRLQHPGRKLPSELEAELAAAPGDTLASAVDRLVALRVAQAVWARTAGANPDRAPDVEAAQTAALQLLAREPVPVPLASGRVVHVTGRSVAAIVEIAAHEAELARLQAEMEEHRALLVRLLARRRKQAAGLRRRWRYRRHHRRLVKGYEDLYTAVLRHRERLVANLATPDGARATLDTPAPDWWRECTPEDDALLFLAAFEAGPGRAARIPSEPVEPGKERDEKPDGLLYPRILTAWGLRLKVRPAALHDMDFGPTWLEMRTAPSYTEEEEE